MRIQVKIELSDGDRSWLEYWSRSYSPVRSPVSFVGRLRQRGYR